jgi:hypothetical protein
MAAATSYLVPFRYVFEVVAPGHPLDREETYVEAFDDEDAKRLISERRDAWGRERFEFRFIEKRLNGRVLR